MCSSRSGSSRSGSSRNSKSTSSRGSAPTRETPKGCQCVVVAVPVVEGLVEIGRVLEAEVVLRPERHQRVVNGRRSMEGTTITSEGWHCLLVLGLEALSFQTFTPRNKL